MSTVIRIMLQRLLSNHFDCAEHGTHCSDIKLFNRHLWVQDKVHVNVGKVNNEEVNKWMKKFDESD